MQGVKINRKRMVHMNDTLIAVPSPSKFPLHSKTEHSMKSKIRE